MSADVSKQHRSHISHKRTRAEGWNKVPPWSIREDTYSMIEEGSKTFMSNSYCAWTEAAESQVESSILNFVGTTTTSGTATDVTYTPGTMYVTWLQNWPSLPTQVNNKRGEVRNTENIRDQFRELAKQTLVREGGDKVEKRTLYRVFVVDPRKGGKVLMNGEPVIANSENQAMLKVGVAKVAGDVSLDIEQVDVYVEEVATFIRPRKETRKVQVLQPGEEDE